MAADEFSIAAQPVRDHTGGGQTDADHLRLTLAHAFSRHLERPEWADCGGVDLFFDGIPPQLSYRYLANDNENGGAHYLRGIAPHESAVVRRLADESGLTVLTDSGSSIVVSFLQPRILEDARFVEAVLAEVFGARITAISGIVERVDRDTRRVRFGVE